jgi:flagellar protein FlgJ
VAISPPSDIVLDVASAADPVKLRAATDRLAKLAADPAISGTSFSASLAAAREPVGTVQSSTTAFAASPGLANARGALGTVSHKDELKTYQKFEAVLLQNFVEAILPKDTELFGDKNSAEIYRSMMAEQFANQLAKSGSLGIAKQIMAAHSPNVPHVTKPVQS